LSNPSVSMNHNDTRPRIHVASRNGWEEEEVKDWMGEWACNRVV